MTSKQMSIRTRVSLRGLTLLVGALSAGGCFYSNPSAMQAFKMPYAVDVTSQQYVLQPPDEIEVHCARVPELDRQRQRIRPDGKVSFEAIGEVEVAGKTPAQVAAILEQKAASLYTLPGDKPIDVRVMAFPSKVYYVLGQVYMPGRKPYTGRDTVLSALADARPNPMAWKDRIQVIRPSRDPSVDSPKIFEVNYGQMVLKGDLSKDVLLEEGDIIWVPPTIPAYVTLKLEELITPIARAFAGVWIVTGGTAGVYPYGMGGGYSGY